MKKYQIILLLILICIPFLASAQLKLENDYEGLDPAGSTTDLFVYFVKMAITFGVIIAVLAIMYNGINMIMAQGEMAKIILAKQRIFSVFIGLLILLGVYIISITINPDFVIIKMSDLQKIGDDIADIITGKDKNSSKVEFEEIPLGSIVESILAANSSKRIEGADDVTEELCYAYDENGDTIDRNGDGKITPEEDTLRGVDMFYCIDELNQAIIKKVKALNAGYLCKGENIDGPMRTILKTIQEKGDDGKYNCDCSRCAKYSLLKEPFGCSTYTAECCYSDEGGETCSLPSFCDNRCSCCGSAYYKPNIACQLLSEAEKYDPCLKTARDKIDCAKNEIKIRIDGKSYDDLPPGAKADSCAFTAFWEDPATDKEKFLTLELAKKRMESFENYYKNHLEDLNLAVNKMRDPYGERLSMVEFQTLKGRADQKEEVLSVPFAGVNGYTYDPVKYCREYNCTNTNEDDVCISGIRDDLTDILYEKEKEIDEFYNVPDFRDRRICKVDDDENKEKYAYSGDGATFYYKEGFKYEESYEKETLRMVTDIGEKGYMESLIPLGELVNDARNFTEKLLEFTGLVKEEVNNVETKAKEFADLSGQCDCSNCKNDPTQGGVVSCNNFVGFCPDNFCDDCSTCYGKGQGKCICCEECETIKVIDTAIYYCLVDNASYGSGQWRHLHSLADFNYYLTHYVGGPKLSCSLSSTDGSPISYTLDYVSNHSFYISGTCGCPSSGTYYRILPACYDFLTEGPAPGIVCSESEVDSVLNFGKWPAYKSTILGGGACTCTLKGGAYSKGICYNPLTGEALSCTSNQLFGGVFDSECYINVIKNRIPNWCIEIVKNLPEAMPFWSVSSCGKVGSQTIVKLKPNNLKEITICEGEEATGFSDSDRKLIEDSNPSKTIEWVEGDKLTYSGLDCCSLYVGNPGEFTVKKNLISLPSEFNGECFYEGGEHIIRITKNSSSTSLSDRGKIVSQNYYACPYNSLKDKQCRIFKYSSIFETENYPEDLVSALDCTNEKSHGIGHLQKIELLAKRIENYGKGENLKEKDPNRWISLDILNLSRKKLDQCITGYGLPLKEGTKSYTLLSCEQGIDTLSFGSAIIYPTFPYPPSDEMWNCQPYNSQKYLTEDQRKACLNNKQHPVCADAVYNLLDDYYCLQREQ